LWSKIEYNYLYNSTFNPDFRLLNLEFGPPYTMTCTDGITLLFLRLCVFGYLTDLN